ncbi:hypothetical protein LUZ63_018846 [Rhynchospora breviuscula]|uniref:YTH domain-containing family protein n=1 Tax=Rhynchospora breviuscula TaxID=2022672 RepID=A0A9Q0C538_9POAL|nr:hypothetical protein LUZ63_018846 [Rhynchospora breviuscula]
MDSTGKSEKSVEKGMKNLKLDSSGETTKPNLPCRKDASSSADFLCVSSGTVRDSEMDHQEPSMGAEGLFYGYAYPGFNGVGHEWHDNTYLVRNNGLEIYPTVMHTDGSYAYYLPDCQTGYSLNFPFVHGALISPDGQYYSPGLLSPTALYSAQWAPAYTWDQSLLFMDGYQETAIVPSSKRSSVTRTKVFPMKSISETKGSSSPQDRSLKAGNNVVGSVPSKSDLLYPTNLDELKATKPKPRAKLNGFYNNSFLTTKEKNAIVRKDVYNLTDFQTKYDQAMFFVIKSYSEDDVHKSIKYNVWASTPNGNKRLDSAFKIAQEMPGKGTKCRVFLFFSVNASGQFCGVAEMVGPVDFSKSMNFWQQDKWTGFFPLKWHIIKDVPNPQFRHIILENNENKPVTNSRDTQEVKFSQGIEMLKIFKNYSYKTSILDDFEFYENRQKAMQDRRSKPSNPSANPLIETISVEASKLDSTKEEKISDGVKIQKESIESN